MASEFVQDLAKYLRVRTSRFFFAEDPHLELAQWLVDDVLPPIQAPNMDAISEMETLRARNAQLERILERVEDENAKQAQYWKDRFEQIRSTVNEEW